MALAFLAAGGGPLYISLADLTRYAAMGTRNLLDARQGLIAKQLITHNARGRLGGEYRLADALRTGAGRPEPRPQVPLKAMLAACEPLVDAMVAARGSYPATETNSAWLVLAKLWRKLEERFAGQAHKMILSAYKRFLDDPYWKEKGSPLQRFAAHATEYMSCDMPTGYENEEQAQDVWGQVREMIRGQIGEQNFRSWFANTTAIGLDDNSLTLSARSEMAADSLECLYRPLIEEAVASVVGERREIRVRG